MAENIRSRILEPAGAFNTAFLYDAGIPYYYSHGYLDWDDDGQLEDVTFIDPSVAGSSGAMISTPKSWRN